MRRMRVRVAVGGLILVSISLLAGLLTNFTDLGRGVQQATPRQQTILTQMMAASPTPLPAIIIAQDQPPPIDARAIILTAEQTALPADGMSTTQLVLSTSAPELMGRRVTFLVRGGGTLTPTGTRLTNTEMPETLTYIAGNTPGRTDIEATIQYNGKLLTQQLSIMLNPITGLALSGEYETIGENILLYRIYVTSTDDVESFHNLVVSVDDNARLEDGQKINIVSARSNSTTEILVYRVGDSPINFSVRLSDFPLIPPLQEQLYDTDFLPSRMAFTQVMLDEARREYLIGERISSCMLAFDARQALIIPPRLEFAYYPILTTTPIDEITLISHNRQLIPPNTFVKSGPDQADTIWVITEDRALCLLLQPEIPIVGLYQLVAGPGPANQRIYSTALIHHGRFSLSQGTSLLTYLSNETPLVFALPERVDAFLLDERNLTETPSAIISGWVTAPNADGQTRFYATLQSEAVDIANFQDIRESWFATDISDQAINAMHLNGEAVFRIYLRVQQVPDTVP